MKKLMRNPGFGGPGGFGGPPGPEGPGPGFGPGPEGPGPGFGPGPGGPGGWGPGPGPMGPPPPPRRGCFVATAVYGSYDCPPVWTLRRYRDEHLIYSPGGRLFIRIYYALSPTFVQIFGSCRPLMWICRKTLDGIVSRLSRSGYSSLPYTDR